MSTHPTWGIVATVKAPDQEILNFAAHHLDLGAARVHIYLDAPSTRAFDALNAHRNCSVTLCDDQYWQRHGYRPAKHQVRQSLNATRCLNSDPQVDWLAHIDVDEFLWPANTPVSDQLALTASDAPAARIRPVEALAPDPCDPPPPGHIWFKSCARRRRRRRAETAAIYPGYASGLNGGFLSHVQGKLFLRTGFRDMTLRLHRAEIAGERIKPCDLPGTRLCHLHAPDFPAWLHHFRFRLSGGAYRDSLSPAMGNDANLHTLLAGLDRAGPDALRDFFQKVCTATPDLRNRLDAHGRLHLIPLDPAAARTRQFPGF